MKAVTKDFIREPGANALTSNDMGSLQRYKAAREAKRTMDMKVDDLELRINRIEQFLGIK